VTNNDQPQEDVSVEQPAPSVPTYDKASLLRMTKPELLDLAKLNGVTASAQMKNADIVSAIMATQGERPAVDESYDDLPAEEEMVIR
jgi:hypothetical protein